MYKISFVSGDVSNVAPILRNTIDDINKSGGTIVQMVQSQSQSGGGYTIVTITIIYTVNP